jgi:uncharacterized protein YcnI
MRTLILAFASAASLLIPAAADAHVTVQPDTAPSGGFTRLDVRVPNERDDAGTKKVEVQLPPGFVFVSYAPIPGWRVKFAHSKLDKPVDMGEGFAIDEQVSRVTWTGDGKQGIVKPGQFQDFGLSVRVPEGKAGDDLIFKALQTYDDGDVVRWIGPKDSDEPAPAVTLTSAADEGSGGAAASAGGIRDQSSAAATHADDGADAISVLALVVGSLALLGSLAALAAARRRTAGTTREQVIA